MILTPAEVAKHEEEADDWSIEEGYIRNSVGTLATSHELLRARVLELEKALKDVSYVGAGVCWCESHIGEHFPHCRQAFRALHQGEMNPEGQ